MLMGFRKAKMQTNMMYYCYKLKASLLNYFLSNAAIFCSSSAGIFFPARIYAYCFICFSEYWHIIFNVVLDSSSKMTA